MSILTKEVGKLFRYSTGYDLSQNTNLALVFTHTDGTTFTLNSTTTPAVTAPAAVAADPDLGSVKANTYMQFTTKADTFVKPGGWSVRGIYEDATPKKFYGTKVSFSVGDSS